jgi:hypothetical protein
MKVPASRKWILGVSGVVGLCIGTALLVMPTTFYATDGVELGHQPGLLSDLRGTGGSMAALGILILAGATRPHFSRVGCWVSTLMYLSYAVSRGLGWALDGRPSALVVTVLVVEIVLGLLGLSTLVTLPRPAGGVT